MKTTKSEFVFSEPIIDTSLKNKPQMIKVVFESKTGNFYYDAEIVSIVGKSKRKDRFYHWVDNGHKFRTNRSYFEFEMPGLYDWMKAHGYEF